MSKNNNMAMVLQALKNAGLNDNQARILGAEIGRENAFQDKYLWGYHSDPKNGALNIGIISWQGSRGKGVEQALKNAGLIQNGKIVKGQASLDVMAKYLVNEIRTNPAYAKTKEKFLDNPNVDYHTGTKVLGTNFIRWRYDDPKYKSGHTNRDKFYRQLGGIVPAGGSQTMNAQDTSQPQTQQPYQASVPQDPLMTPFAQPQQSPFGASLVATPAQGMQSLVSPDTMFAGLTPDSMFKGLDVNTILQGMGSLSALSSRPFM